MHCLRPAGRSDERDRLAAGVSPGPCAVPRVRQDHRPDPCWTGSTEPRWLSEPEPEREARTGRRTALPAAGAPLRQVRTLGPRVESSHGLGRTTFRCEALGRCTRAGPTVDTLVASWNRFDSGSIWVVQPVLSTGSFALSRSWPQHSSQQISLVLQRRLSSLPPATSPVPPAPRAAQRRATRYRRPPSSES
ncbi:MAG: hypothetical protein QOG22_949 [Pseudonocardiales bacterium]|jgi:hypothetical protein|nr:hypothetical protein [Pseudonocardiales bacterium]